MIQMKILFAIVLILLWVLGIYEGDSGAAVLMTLGGIGALLQDQEEKRKKARRCRR